MSAYGPRLLAALIAGSVIGIEGEIFRRAAGLRTTILVMLGTTLFAILSVVVAQKFGGDPARIAAQIVTGIGFLGAGVIMHEGEQVYGITTAATIYTTAAIGVTIGFGYVWTGVALALVTALVLMVFRPIHRFIQNLEIVQRYREKEFRAALADKSESGTSLKRLAPVATKSRKRK